MPTGPGETANRALGGKEDGGKERGAVGGRVRNALLCILQSGAEAVHTPERETQRERGERENSYSQMKM